MWPFKRGEVEYPFRGLIQAMRTKDAALFDKIGNLSPVEAMERWVEVYPEDFPERGNSPAHESSIKPKAALN